MTREEAIEVIKAKADYLESDKRFRAAVETIIPELAESEDERIKKIITDCVFYQYGAGAEYKDVLDYLDRLEKQKEVELTEEDKKIIPEALVMLCNDIINHRVHTPIRTDEEGARKIKTFLKTINRQPHKTKEEWEKQKEQKPVDDKAFEEWIDDWWKHNKVNNPDSYDKGDEIQFDEKGFKNFCRGIRNMYVEQKPVVTHGETYHVDTLGTQQVIAGKMPQKPTECKATINGEPIPTENQSVDIPLAKWSDSFEDTLNAFLFNFAHSPIEDCEPNEYIKKHADGILKAAYKELRTKLEQDIFEAKQEGIRDGIASVEPAEWSEEDSDNLERVDNYLWMLDNYVGDDCAMPQGKTDKIRENIHKVLSPWLKSLPERFNLQPRQEWSEEDEKMLKSIIEDITPVGECPDYPTDEEREYYYSGQDKMNWLKGLSNRFNLQPKSEWSEDDVKRIKQLIYDTEHIRAEYKKGKEIVDSNFNDSLIKDCDEQITWLNNLLTDCKRRNADIAKLCSNEWSEEDENKIESIKGLITMGRFADTNTIKTIWELLDSLYPQPKQEWSEEDEETIGTLINYFEGDALDYSTDEMVRRIKALRPSWKPSEEQMDAFHTVLYQPQYISNSDDERLKQAESLYNDLEKLM